MARPAVTTSTAEHVLFPPVRVHMPGGIFGDFPNWALFLIVAAVAGMLVLVIRMRRKVKCIEKKLEFEMNDVQKMANIGPPRGANGAEG